MQGYIDSYQAEHANVTIDWVDVPGNEVAQKYATALSGGNAPDAANIYQMARFIEFSARCWRWMTMWHKKTRKPLVPSGKQERLGATTMQSPGILRLRARLWSMAYWPRRQVWIWTIRRERGKKSLRSVARPKMWWGPGVFPWVDCWTSRSWAFEEGLDLLNEDFTAAAVNTPEWEAHINTILGLHEDGLLGLDAYACPDVRVSIDLVLAGHRCV